VLFSAKTQQTHGLHYLEEEKPKKNKTFHLFVLTILETTTRAPFLLPVKETIFIQPHPPLSTFVSAFVANKGQKRLFTLKKSKL